MKKIILSMILATILLFPTVKLQSQGWVKTVVAVTGNVFDHVTREPVAAKITVFDETGKKVNSTKSNAYENGYYYVTSLSAGKTYNFVIENDGYLKEKIQVKIAPSDKYEEISRDFLVKPNEVGKMLKLPTSPFEINKSKLRFGSGIVLDDMANSFVNNPNVKFAIVSYPDKAGDADNAQLTKDRSQALLDYFAIKGISPDRMTAEGSADVDSLNPPPIAKQSKGKRYIGPTYIKILGK